MCSSGVFLGLGCIKGEAHDVHDIDDGHKIEMMTLVQLHARKYGVLKYFIRYL
jgi:hypothetical protein